MQGSNATVDLYRHNQRRARRPRRAGDRAATVIAHRQLPRLSHQHRHGRGTDGYRYRRKVFDRDGHVRRRDVPERTLSGSAPADGEVLRAVPVETAPGLLPADLFFIERGSSFRIRATTFNGREVWTYTTTRPVKQVAADNAGGVVLVLQRSFRDLLGPYWWMYADTEAVIQRLDGTTGRISWQYVPNHDYTSLEALSQFSEVAIRADNTIFVVETLDTKTQLVALDGARGSVAGRYDLGHMTSHRWVDGVNDWNPWWAANVTAPVVLADGRVAVAAYQKETYEYYKHDYVPGCGVRLVPEGGPLDDEDEEKLSLFTIADGTLAMTEQEVALDNLAPFEFESTADLDRLLPDGRGGLLLAVSDAGLVYRISPAHVLLRPTVFRLFGDRISGETEYVVTDTMAHALVQRATRPTPIHAADLIRFDAETLAPLSDEPVFTDPSATPHLKFASNDSVFLSWWPTDQLVNGIWAGWIAGPALDFTSPINAEPAPWAQPRNRGNQNAIKTYRTTDAAAVSVLREIVPYSNALHREFGGQLCTNDVDRYFVWPAKVGEQGEVFLAKCVGFPAAANYHTHHEEDWGTPPIPPVDGPSGRDIINSYGDGLIAYIGVAADFTANQVVDCAPLGLGNIWKYQLDVSVPLNTNDPKYTAGSGVIACTRK